MILGLCGYTGVGKDAIAEHLVSKYGFVRVAFADAMREDLLKLNPIVKAENWCFHRLSQVVSEIGWDEAKRRYPEVRRLLQVYGTEVGRDGFGEQCWILRAKSKIRTASVLGDSAVVTDVRFENEVNCIRGMCDFETHIIHVIRPNHGPINSHVSEQLDYAAVADCTIINESTLEKLHESVDALLEGFLCKSTKSS